MIPEWFMRLTEGHNLAVVTYGWLQGHHPVLDDGVWCSHNEPSPYPCSVVREVVGSPDWLTMALLEWDMVLPGWRNIKCADWTDETMEQILYPE